MYQVSLETICPLKAFQLYYCPDNDAKSVLKHFIFLHKFSVVRGFVRRPLVYKLGRINLARGPGALQGAGPPFPLFKLREFCYNNNEN